MPYIKIFIKNLASPIHALMRIIYLLVLPVCFWELIVLWFQIPHYILPKPSDILSLLYNPHLRSILLEHTKVTLIETLYGLISAIFFAFILAVFIQKYPFLSHFLLALCSLVQSLPSVIIVPILLMIFGFSLMTKVTVVCLYSFFPIFMNFHAALEQIDPAFLSLFKSLRASFWQKLYKLQLRWALPGFFSGLKIAATYSVSNAVLAEFFGAEMGLGIAMRNAFSSSRVSLLFLIAFIIAISSTMLVICTTLIEQCFYSFQNRTRVKMEASSCKSQEKI